MTGYFLANFQCKNHPDLYPNSIILMYALVTRLPNHLRHLQIKYIISQRAHKLAIAMTSARESFILKFEVLA